ncbi:MAG: lipopolysaccharide biosynthesis protein [Alphaproteobacteria bacterium]|nr:lipopolysaccharide biosynthesis protein [Alphaproteobacteria bacterium]
MFKASDIKIGIIWRMIEVVGAEFFAFCSFLVLTRLLAPEHFGVVALATILILVAQLVLFQGVGEALVQIEEIETSWFSSALWMNVALASLAALILIAAAPAIAIAFSEPRFAPVLRAVAPLLLIYSVSGILQAKLRRDLKLKGFAFASILATILGAIVAAVMAIKGFEVWSLVCQQWAYALTSTIMFLLHAGWRPKLRIEKAHIERLAGFSFNTIGAALLRFALRQLDLLFLGLHLPSKQVGLYFLATRILNTVGQLTYYSIQRLGLPVLARLQNDPVRQQAAINATLRLTCLVCLPIFFGLALIADLAIPMAFGWDWTGSIEPFRILCLFSIFYAMSLIANQILLSAGHASTVFRLSVMNALLFATAVGFAAPHGIKVTAVAGGLANALCLPLYFYVLRQKLRIDLAQVGADLLPIWTAATAMAVAVLAARFYLLNALDQLLTLGLAILLGALVFAGVIWLLRRDYVDELTTAVLGERPGNHAP